MVISSMVNRNQNESENKKKGFSLPNIRMIYLPNILNHTSSIVTEIGAKPTHT